MHCGYRHYFRTIIGWICHELYCAAAIGFLLGASHLAAQTSPATSTPAPEQSPSTNPNDAPPPPGEVVVEGVTKTVDGPWVRVREMVKVEDSEMRFLGDEADYNTDTGDVEARNNIRFLNHSSGETLQCSLARYNVDTGNGTFYDVTGTAPPRIETKPGLLTTTNPYYFTGKVVEKQAQRYIVRNGTITDCRPEKVWWQLSGSTIDIIPGQRAIVRNAWLKLLGVPVFYTPFFYKSLDKQPRRSGFLTPNIGNSSLRGQMVGGGYFWAINRSHDLTYRVQYYTKRGSAHQADLRGVLNEGSFYNASVFGLPEQVEQLTDANGNPYTRINEGGYLILADGESRLGNGWMFQGELRQLSSFRFRQQFTQSFDEAINSQVHSVTVLSKHGQGWGFTAVGQRNVNYQTDNPGDEIVLRKLPEASLTVREHSLWGLPLYAGLDTSFGLQRRTQPLFQTRQFVQRADFSPYIMTAFHKWGFDIAPSFSLRETFYDSSRRDQTIADSKLMQPVVVGTNLVRSTQDFMVDLSLPSLSGVFAAPKWLRAPENRVKHVIEPRITYRYVRGVDAFRDVLRFDERDLISNTNEVEFSLTNRLLTRDGHGGASDLLTWELWYKRYLDPTFGGALSYDDPARRNVLESSLDLTGYAFLNRARNQSPIVSVFRMQSRINLQWRADYDPVRKGFVNSSISVDGRVGQLFLMVGHHQLRTDPALAPNSNQMRAQVNYGSNTRRGWNYAYSIFYDYKGTGLQSTQAQISYNTDCCGFSVQHTQWGFSVRPENQFRVAFVISNIGSFGTLRRQQTMF